MVHKWLLNWWQFGEPLKYADNVRSEGGLIRTMLSNFIVLETPSTLSTLMTVICLFVHFYIYKKGNLNHLLMCFLLFWWGFTSLWEKIIYFLCFVTKRGFRCMMTINCGLSQMWKWIPHIGFLMIEPYYSLRLFLPLELKVLLAHTLIFFLSN